MKEQIKGVNRDERDEAGQLNHRMEQNASCVCCGGIGK